MGSTVRQVRAGLQVQAARQVPLAEMEVLQTPEAPVLVGLQVQAVRQVLAGLQVQAAQQVLAGLQVQAVRQVLAGQPGHRAPSQGQLVWEGPMGSTARQVLAGLQVLAAQQVPLAGMAVLQTLEAPVLAGLRRNGP